MDHIRDRLRSINQEKGVTGLETAIILIALVVVASVFAFTVLSTGIFSVERGKETIHAGLRGARSSMELKGSIVANGVANKTLSSGDTVWTAVSTLTASTTADTTDKKQGTASADILVGPTFTTVLVAYQDLPSTLDFSSIDSVSLWVKYVTTTASGDLDLVLDNTAACGSSLENIDLPVLVGGAWTLVTVGITDNSDMTAIKCVGLNLTTDDGTQTANLDNIVDQGQATLMPMGLPTLTSPIHSFLPIRTRTR